MFSRRDFVKTAPALIGHPARSAAQNPPVPAEARGVWLHPENLFEADPAKGKEQARAIVRRLADAHFNLILPWIKSEYPRKLIFSANGGYNWRTDRKSGRDWGRWARHGWLDYYAAQVYVTDTDLFRKRLSMTVKDLGQDCPVYAGIAFRWSRGQNTVPEVLRQIEAAREQGAAGEVLFYAGAFNDELFEALQKGPFRSTKLPPAAR